MGEKQGGDFGQAGNQDAEAGDDGNHNKSSKEDGVRIDKVPDGVESENSGLGDKQGGDFGQAAEGKDAEGNKSDGESDGSRAASTDQ